MKRSQEKPPDDACSEGRLISNDVARKKKGLKSSDTRQR